MFYSSTGLWTSTCKPNKIKYASFTRQETYSFHCQQQIDSFISLFTAVRRLSLSVTKVDYTINTRATATLFGHVTDRNEGLFFGGLNMVYPPPKGIK